VRVEAVDSLAVRWKKSFFLLAIEIKVDASVDEAAQGPPQRRKLDEGAPLAPSSLLRLPAERAEVDGVHEGNSDAAPKRLAENHGEARDKVDEMARVAEAADEAAPEIPGGQREDGHRGTQRWAEVRGGEREKMRQRDRRCGGETRRDTEVM
jgi:hypothetical protein